VGTGIPVTKASVHEKGAVMRALSVARFVVASLETAGGRQRRVSGRDPLHFRPLVPCCVCKFCDGAAWPLVCLAATL
jgi:hypothetical protein